jgi:hypothetical protein
MKSKNTKNLESRVRRASIALTTASSIGFAAHAIELPDNWTQATMLENMRVTKNIDPACMDEITTSGDIISTATFINMHDPDNINAEMSGHHVKTAVAHGMPVFLALNHTLSETNKKDYDSRNGDKPSSMYNSASGAYQFIDMTALETVLKHHENMDFSAGNALNLKAVKTIYEQHNTATEAGIKEFWNNIKKRNLEPAVFQILNWAYSLEGTGQVYAEYHLAMNPFINKDVMSGASFEEYTEQTGKAYARHFMGPAGGKALVKYSEEHPEWTVAQTGSIALARAYKSNKHLFRNGMNTTMKVLYEDIIAYGTKHAAKIIAADKKLIANAQNDFGKVNNVTLCARPMIDQEGRYVSLTTTGLVKTWSDTQREKYIGALFSAENLTPVPTLKPKMTPEENDDSIVPKQLKPESLDTAPESLEELIASL